MSQPPQDLQVFFCVETGRALVISGMQLYGFTILMDFTVSGPTENPHFSDTRGFISLDQCVNVDIDIGPFPFDALKTYMLTHWLAHKLFHWFSLVFNAATPARALHRFTMLFDRYAAQATPEAFELFRARIVQDAEIKLCVAHHPCPFAEGSKGEQYYQLVTQAR